MKLNHEIKQTVLLIAIMAILVFLAFSLETSEINNITEIKILGNKYLDESVYLKYSKLENFTEVSELSITLIRDRIEKHPYVKNLDVVVVERGIAEVTIFEKKMDAILLDNSDQYMITGRAEIIPLIASTRHLDLPVIVRNSKKTKIKLFEDASLNEELLSALKIISTAELYDKDLYNSISEINLNKKNEISVQISKISSPIYFGNKNEIEKTVFLSKIFKHMKSNNLSDYLNYVDLRYNELVYLGFDEQIIRGKETI